jgi:hypothetical protein
LGQDTFTFFKLLDDHNVKRWASGGNKVAEHLPHYPMSKGSSQVSTACTGREKIAKNQLNISVLN